MAPRTGWEKVQDDNGGIVEYRFVVEGGEVEFCTSLAMVVACTESGQDGKRRVAGLQREGLGFTETAYLAGAEIDVAINSITIVETPDPDLGAASLMFSKNPSVIGALSLSLSESGASTTATVYDSTDFTIGGYYHIGTEVVKVTAKPTSTTLTVQRAKWRTFIQAHNRATGASATERPFEDGVSQWKHRRCWLYAHGVAIDGSGDIANEYTASDTGAIVWRGRIAEEPELNPEGTAWTFPVESRWQELEQEIGSRVDVARHIRGIYYPGEWRFGLHVELSSTSSIVSASTATVDIFVPVGFYRDNEAWGSAVAVALNADATIASWGITFASRVLAGRWELFVTTKSATPGYIRVIGGNAIEGFFTGRLGPATFNVSADTTRELLGDEHSALETVAAATEYLCMWDHRIFGFVVDGDPALQRLEPRTLSARGGWRGGRHGTDTDIANYPVGRMYLDDVSGIAVGDTLFIPQRATEEGVDPITRDVVVSAVSTSAGSVEAYVGGTVEAPPNVAGCAASLPEITVSKRYGATEGTSLAGFRDALVAAAPVSANDAATPWILDDDLADWTDAVDDASNGRALLTTRRYTFKKPQRCDELIREECKLLGVYPYLDADFKIALRRLTVETAAVASGRTIGGADQIVDAGYGRIRNGTDGHVNVVEFGRGYDPGEDKFTDGPIQIVDVGAVSRAKRRAVIEIKPKVVADAEITEEQARQLSGPIRAFFGGRISHVTVDVPISYFGVLVGSIVALNVEELPFDGYRTVHDPGLGMVNRRALVVARKWDLDTGVGTLTCLCTNLDVLGYSPSARVESAVGALKTWTLTCTASHYAPNGGGDVDYFQVGDKIRIIEWDAAAPTIREGEIAGVNTGDAEVDVQLDADWTGMGAALYYTLDYADSDVVTATQRDTYCAIAGATQRYADGGSGRRARSFAP